MKEHFQLLKDSISLTKKSLETVANDSASEKGLAADLVCADMPKLESILRETGGFDQLIKEHLKGCNRYWYHVSICPRNGKPRNQIIMNLEKK